jgi:hypothetical protein
MDQPVPDCTPTTTKTSLMIVDRSYIRARGFDIRTRGFEFES